MFINGNIVLLRSPIAHFMYFVFFTMLYSLLRGARELFRNNQPFAYLDRVEWIERVDFWNLKCKRFEYQKIRN